MYAVILQIFTPSSVTVIKFSLVGACLSDSNAILSFSYKFFVAIAMEVIFCIFLTTMCFPHFFTITMTAVVDDLREPVSRSIHSLKAIRIQWIFCHLGVLHQSAAADVAGCRHFSRKCRYHFHFLLLLLLQTFSEDRR